MNRSLRAASACAALLFALLPGTPVLATYSIIARDPDTGEIGGAVQSHWFKVGDVIWIEPGVGAVATQSLVDFTYGPAGLELLRLGRSAEKALEGLIASDEASEVRQVAILDGDGNIAAHTGKKCIDHAGHVTGENYSVQANLMMKDTVPAAMARAFEKASGDLAERLMAALEAAQAEGGDIRGQQSAALFVAGPKNTGRHWADFRFDLRVDDNAQPVKELRRLLQTARAYDAMNEGDLAIEKKDFERAEEEYGEAAKLAPRNAEVLFWHAVALVNAGRVEDALPLFAKTYSIDKNWRQLPARLVKAELLPDDPAILKQIESGKAAKKR
jgi:uncharacterized Ntn-hydrolase superfamily protein